MEADCVGGRRATGTRVEMNNFRCFQLLAFLSQKCCFLCYIRGVRAEDILNITFFTKARYVHYNMDRTPVPKWNEPLSLCYSLSVTTVFLGCIPNTPHKLNSQLVLAGSQYLCVCQRRQKTPLISVASCFWHYRTAGSKMNTSWKKEISPRNTSPDWLGTFSCR